MMAPPGLERHDQHDTACNKQANQDSQPYLFPSGHQRRLHAKPRPTADPACHVSSDLKYTIGVSSKVNRAQKAIALHSYRQQPRLAPPDAVFCVKTGRISCTSSFISFLHYAQGPAGPSISCLIA